VSRHAARAADFYPWAAARAVVLWPAVNSQSAPRFLAAIDLDGTLLGHDGILGAENQAALERLVGRGIGIVLASGRHALNMAEIARGMPMVRGLVSCQGCEASDPQRRRIYVQRFLESADIGPAVAVGLEAGFGVIAYTERGERTVRDGPQIDRYRRITGTPINEMPLAAVLEERIYKMMWIADEAMLDAFLARGGAKGCQPQGSDPVRSHREVFEFVPHGVSKATGTAALAREFGVPAARIVGFGDAENDVPLFDWAGYSVVMPHARPEVRRHAKLTAPAGDAESAFARGVDVLLASPFVAALP